MFAPAFSALLAGWNALGYSVVSLHDYAAGLDLARLPRRDVTLPSGKGTEATTEGEEFLLGAAGRDP